MATRANLRVIQGFLRDKDNFLPTDESVEVVIGRDHRCTIPIMNRKVSRNHCKITYKNGVYSITDLSSKAGTKINNRKVDNCVLRRNDEIQIGPVQFKFVLEDTDQTAATKELPKLPSQPVMIAPKPIVEAPKPPPAPAEKRKDPSTIFDGPAFTPEELSMVGETIAGVRIISAVGRGRRTLVYKGTQSEENRVVALKILTPEAAKDPDMVKWFIEGARQAGEIRHEEIVPLLGGGRQGKMFFVLTLFMDAGDARRQFARTVAEGVPSVKRALETLVHITRALEYAKGKGMMHLGIRPSKILFGERSKPKLNGLGFDNSIYAPGAVRTADVESYVAPDVLAGGKLSASSDIYGLGASFYYMLTARRPQRDLRKRLPSPKDYNPSVPDSICRIVEKSVNPDPAERYPTYGQLLHDLRWALRGEAWPH
jgi:pSer/pThr/pTyr-binding forkhead associated (FHA) protein